MPYITVRQPRFVTTPSALSNWRPGSEFWINVAAVGMFAGVLYFLNKVYREKEEDLRAARLARNPSDWTSWKWQFIRAFRRRWGYEPKVLGFRSRDYRPYFDRGLTVKGAVTSFSRTHGIDHDTVLSLPGMCPYGGPRRRRVRSVPRRRRRRNPRKNYYVKFVGEPMVYGPHPLKGAKSFARIGSQTGRDRIVYRGDPRRGGKRIRRYSGGERVWPTKPAQVSGLLSAEVPRKLSSGKGRK